MITQTIERWDGQEAARRIELHVGRDLQFIRINGTVVGGLVGVVIHALAVLGCPVDSERDMSEPYDVPITRRRDPAGAVPQAGQPRRVGRRGPGR